MKKWAHEREKWNILTTIKDIAFFLKPHWSEKFKEGGKEVDNDISEKVTSRDG